MSKKVLFLLIAAVCTPFVIWEVCYALRMLTMEEALEKVFQPGAEIVTETKELTGEQLTKVKEELGGSLVYYQKGSKSAKVKSRTAITFFFAVNDGKKTGVAVIDVEPGKWGPVEFIIALNLDGSVKRVEVMSYREKRGRPIARRSFMKQFDGKTIDDPLKVRKDIRGISGATISSKCAAFAVKKALALYNEIYTPAS